MTDDPVSRFRSQNKETKVSSLAMQFLPLNLPRVCVLPRAVVSCACFYFVTVCYAEIAAVLMFVWRVAGYEASQPAGRIPGLLMKSFLHPSKGCEKDIAFTVILDIVFDVIRYRFSKSSWFLPVNFTQPFLVNCVTR